MHSGYSHWYKLNVFYGMYYRQINVLHDDLDVPHGSLLYDKRLGGTVPRDFWNYRERCEKFNHSRENDLVSLTAKAEIKRVDFDWKYTPSYQFEYLSVKTFKMTEWNIWPNLFFILRIIVIWENLLGKVYSGSFFSWEEWYPEKKVMSITFQNCGVEGWILEKFSGFNSCKKLITLFVLPFHMNSDSKKWETQVAVMEMP